MYIPNHFKIEDKTIVEDFISTYSFGTLISSLHSTRNWAVHLPFQWHSKPDGILNSHLAIQNELAVAWQKQEKISNVLCIFQGPDAYISSKWYQKEDVPTWNYLSVHCYGSVYKVQGDELLHDLQTMLNTYESKELISLSSYHPKTLNQIKGILGFRFHIEEIHASFKLSQHKKQDHERILAELEARDHKSQALAQEMRKFLDQK